MYKTTLVLLTALLFFSGQSNAQKNDYVYYDSLTYKLYMEKDYKQLIKKGKEALHSGFDYYYLRMRIGIAYYNQKKYRLAAPHFKKALSFSDNDIVKEYLYYSYIWGGEPLMAERLINDMSNALKDKLRLGKSGVLATSVDMAYLIRAEDFPDDLDFPSLDPGTQIIPENFFNMSAGMSHKLGKGASMSHMLTYLHKGNDKYSYDPDYYPAPNDPYYPFNNNFNTNQFQYYLASAISLGRSWNLIFGGHIATVAVPEYNYYETMFRGQLQYRYSQSSSWDFDYALSGSILKNFGRASIEGEFAIMSMNNVFIMQPSGILRLYPLGNLNLYTQSRFSYSIKDNSGTFFQEQKLGFKALKHLWLEGTYFSGGVSGFTLDNNAMFYNGLEEINSMAGGKLIIPTNTKFSLSMGYQFRKMTNYFYTNDDINLKSNNLELNYSLFFITLLWTL